MNSYSEPEKLMIYAQQIQESGIDITPDQKNEWTQIAYACASQGEAGREPYHLICSNYPGYSREETDRHFSYCLKTSKNCVSLGSLVKIAKDHGLELKLPRGRRTKTGHQKKQESEDRMTQAYQLLRGWAQWRFNTWLNRAEILEPGESWRPIRDRDLSTYYCRLKETGMKISAKDVEHIIFNRDFTSDFDPFRAYLEQLPKWQEGDPDYIHDFFTGHMVFGDPENQEFYDLMFRKWFTGMVGLWHNMVDENPIMPVFYGHQHIGKTFFVRHILPPQLSSYLFPVNPSSRVDKDFEISMSETPLMFLDEFNVSNLQKSEAYKYAITASKSYLRDSYAHFREMRDRKASLIAATNHDKFIREAEGDRRYLAVDLAGTINLNDHPLPYEGAYAQALWLLENGFNPKPNQEESQMISDHNLPFLMPDDVTEALLTFVRMPEDIDNPEAYSAGDLLKELNTRGFHGRGFTTMAIGKAMKALGFEAKKKRGTYKYSAVLADFDRQQRERKQDAAEDTVMPF